MSRLSFRWLWLLGLTLAIYGCGGGGSADTASSPNAPTAAADNAAGSEPPATLIVSAEKISLNVQSHTVPKVIVPASRNRINAIAVGFLSNAKLPDWLKFNLYFHDDAFHITFYAVGNVGPPFGEYKSSVRIVGLFAEPDQNLDDAEVISYRDVEVSYWNRDRLRIESATDVRGIEAGAPLSVNPIATFEIKGEGLAWKMVDNDPVFVFKPSSGVGSTTVQVFADGQRAALNPATISFGSERRMGYWRVQSEDLQSAEWFINYTISGQRLMFLSSANAAVPSVEFSYRVGQPLPSTTVRVQSSDSKNVGWYAQVSSPKLTIDRSNGGHGDQLTIAIDPSQLGSASADFEEYVQVSGVSDGQAYLAFLPIRISVDRPELLMTSYGDLGGTYDRSTVYARSRDGRSLSWRVSRKPAWLTITPSSGVTTVSGEEVLFTLDRSLLAKGETSDTYELTALDNGVDLKFTFPVRVNLDEFSLRVPEATVALAYTPGAARTSAEVVVTDNFRTPTRVAASSDQPWLAVDVSTALGAPLRVTANPAGLANNTLHRATVTIRGAPGSAATSTALRVAFWVGAQYPGTQRVLAGAYRKIAIDPIRPVVYVNDGQNLSAVHLYTGASMGTLVGLGTALGNMTVLADGSKLFALDGANPGRILGVALPTLTRTGEQFAAYEVNQFSAPYQPRPGFDGTLHSYGDALLGSHGVWWLNPLGPPQFDWGRNAADHHASDLPSDRLSAVGVSYDGRLYAATEFREYPSLPEWMRWPSYGLAVDNFSNALDVAPARLGTATYLTGLDNTGCAIVDVGPIGFKGSLRPIPGRPNNIEVAKDGKIYCGVDVAESDRDLWVFDSNQVTIGSARIGTGAGRLVARSLNISADGLMIAALTSDGALRLLPARTLAQAAITVGGTNVKSVGGAINGAKYLRADVATR